MSSPCLIVQARMGGTRFPGKVLAPFLGEPMLLRQLKSLQQVHIPSLTLVVACPATKENTVLRLWCEKWEVECSCPDVAEEDVLARYMETANQYEADTIIRVTADCPLIDPEVICSMWEQWQRESSLDHLGIDGRWADGQDVEMFSREALTDAYVNAEARSDREHVTPFIWRQPGIFQCDTLPCPDDCSWQQYSVDTPEDLALAEKLAEKAFALKGFYYGWRDLSILLKQDVELRRLHEGRPMRNHRYLQQVNEEQGHVSTWDELRYGYQ